MPSPLNRRDRTAVVFIRWVLAALLLQSVWVKANAGFDERTMASLLGQWTAAGAAPAWLVDLLEAMRPSAHFVALAVQVTEAVSGLLLFLGLLFRPAALLVALLYGLRYLAAPDPLALLVALLALALFVSDAGRSVRLIKWRRRAAPES